MTITNKRDVPEVSKYIKEDSTSTYGKTADYSQGEENIAFRIVGTLPDATNYARYQSYQYAFTDNMTNMTYVADSLTAKVYTGYTDENNLGTEYGTLDLTDSNVTLSASGSNISLAFADLKVATYTDATITAGVPADAPGCPGEGRHSRKPLFRLSPSVLRRNETAGGHRHVPGLQSAADPGG